MMPPTVSSLFLLCVTVTGAAGAQEYVRRSQRATVSQTVNTTVITVSYGRPGARGRHLFGPNGIVIHSPWTPGADEATVVEFSRGVRVAGHDLAAGRYSLWFRPDRDPWGVLFSSAADVWHVPYRPGHEVLELALPTTQADAVELLTFTFPEVATDSAVLRFAWGTTRLDIPISVDRVLDERPPGRN